VRPKAPLPAPEQAPGGERRRVIATVAAIAGLGWRGGAAGAAAAKTHRVVVQGFKYLPEMLVVRRGDTVVWVNDDPMPHTVTATGEFDSRSIAAGKSWRLLAQRAGSYAYICTLHSNMRGSLTIE